MQTLKNGMASKKKSSCDSANVGCHFFQIKPRWAPFLPRFPEVFSRFSPNQNFWAFRGCASTPASYTTVPWCRTWCSNCWTGPGCNRLIFPVNAIFARITTVEDFLHRKAIHCPQPTMAILKSEFK